MNELNIEDIKLKLLADEPINIDGIGRLKLPTTKEVIRMGESYYNTLIAYLLFSKKSIPDIDEELDKLSDFEVLTTYLYHDPAFQMVFFEGLELLLKVRPVIFDSGLVYFGDLSLHEEFIDETILDQNSILTEEKMQYIQECLKIANFIQEEQEEEYVAGNERARKFMEKLKKKKAEAPKPKSKQSLHSIISSVGWKSIGMDKVLNLTIYQLYNGLRTLDYIDNYHYTLTGIYTGNVDSSKIKLADLHWANIIK